MFHLGKKVCIDRSDFPPAEVDYMNHGNKPNVVNAANYSLYKE